MEAIADTPSVFAECPVWLPGPQYLCWIDCAAGRLFAFDWQTRRTVLLLERPGVLFAGLVRRDQCRLVLLTGEGAYLVAMSGETSTLPLPPEIDAGLLNDGKCDAAGRLWLGTVRSAPGRADGKLFRVAPHGAAPAVAGLGIPNGPAFDAAGGLYVADSLAGIVTRWTLDAEGGLSAPQAVAWVSIAEGQPDGMTVDADGRLFVALHEGGALLTVDRAGRRERIAAPVPRPTSCAFGGPDLRTLFVTAAHGDWPQDRRRPGTPPPADPVAPSLFALPMTIPGLAEPDCTAFAAESRASEKEQQP